MDESNLKPTEIIKLKKQKEVLQPRQKTVINKDLEAHFKNKGKSEISLIKEILTTPPK